MTSPRTHPAASVGRLAPRGSWRRRAGASAVVGAGLLMVATVLEYFVLGPGAPDTVFALFLLLFVASLAFTGAAATELALGGRGAAGGPDGVGRQGGGPQDGGVRRGGRQDGGVRRAGPGPGGVDRRGGIGRPGGVDRRGGIGRQRGQGAAVGSSTLGRLALLTYGGAWIVSQLAYLVYKYLLPPSNWNFFVVVFSTVFLALSFGAGFVAAVMVASAHVVIGLARWCLFVSLVCSVICGAVSSGSDSLALLAALEIIAALGQVFVGVVFLFARVR